jgi:hypothetical protein
MRAERAETLRSLIWAQINAGQDAVPEDFPALVEAIATVREPSHRRPLDEAEQEIREALEKGQQRGSLAVAHPCQPAEPCRPSARRTCG